MTNIITVRLEDTHRRPNARPLDRALVDEITESIGLIGFMPNEALTLRRDGDIYWVVDGGHRREAAIQAGMTEVPALVEDYDDERVLTIEGALNLQRADTAAERWARAQQFMALGVGISERNIAVATGLQFDEQAKARKVLAKLADPTAAEDLTLDQAMAAHEFLDDDEAFARIMDAGVNWENVYGDIKRERVVAEKVAEAEEVIRKAACQLITSDDIRNDVHQYITQTDASKGAPAGAEFARLDAYGMTVYITWYKVRGEQTTIEDEQRTQERQEYEERMAKLDAARALRMEFLAKCLSDPDVIFIGATALKEFAESYWFDAESEYIGKTSIADELEVATGFLPSIYAALLSEVDDCSVLAMKAPKAYHAISYGEQVIAYFAALEASGYQPSEAEEAALETITGTVAKDKDDAYDEADADGEVAE